MARPKAETNRAQATLCGLLGARIGQLLPLAPCSGWKLNRTHQRELSEVQYEFEGRGVSVLCDEKERIHTIFLTGADGEALSGVPFSLTRRAVVARFGPPVARGGPVAPPGAEHLVVWDRFELPGCALHVQYRTDLEGVGMVTLMYPAVVP